MKRLQAGFHLRPTFEVFRIRCSLSILFRIILSFSEIITAFSVFISLIFLFNEILTSSRKRYRQPKQTEGARLFIPSY